MTALLPAHATDRPIEVWFQDEARVGQKGTLTRIWAERGSRPPKPRDQRHGSVWLFGAVCPDRGVGAGLVTGCINAEAMSLHLDEISFHVAPGAHAVVVLDGAGWHQLGQRLRVPDNITLMPLPPYCPELNPVENIWEYLRQNDLSFTVWDSIDAIVDACCNAWNKLIKAPDKIISIAQREWANVSSR